MDPLKDIAFAPVEETKEEVAMSLFNMLFAVLEDVEKLTNVEAKKFLKNRLELVLSMMNAEGILGRKSEITAIIDSLVTQLRVCHETGHLRVHV